MSDEVKRGPEGLFAPGTKRGPGRPKGSLNRVTQAIKDMVAEALDRAGGVDYLARQAEENPTAFLTLVGKVLPLQVTGGDGGALTLHVVTGVPRKADAGS